MTDEPDARAMIRNERTRLVATGLNNLAVATCVTALIAPAVSVMYGFASRAATPVWLIVGIFWFSGALVLHLAAQMILGSLKP